MSRGLGKVERELLDELERTGMVTVAPRELSAAEKEARRRAARSLDRKGLAAVRQNRGTNLLLTMRKAVDWDVRHGERALEKAQEKENEARKEGWNAWRAVRVADPSIVLTLLKNGRRTVPNCVLPSKASVEALTESTCSSTTSNLSLVQSGSLVSPLRTRMAALLSAPPLLKSPEPTD